MQDRELIRALGFRANPLSDETSYYFYIIVDEPVARGAALETSNFRGMNLFLLSFLGSDLRITDHHPVIYVGSIAETI